MTNKFGRFGPMHVDGVIELPKSVLLQEWTSDCARLHNTEGFDNCMSQILACKLLSSSCNKDNRCWLVRDGPAMLASEIGLRTLAAAILYKINGSSRHSFGVCGGFQLQDYQRCEKQHVNRSNRNSSQTVTRIPAAIVRSICTSELIQ